MIKSNNTINIEGTPINHDDLREYLSIDGNDPKTKWLAKPLILISGIGLAVCALFVSFFFVAVSLVLVPVLGVAIWAMKPNPNTSEERTEAASEAPTTGTDETDTGSPIST